MSGTIGDNVYRASGVIASAAGGISWQSVETGASFTAVAGNGYPVNTTAQACTITLPAGSVGDTIELVDYAGTWDTNNVTLTADGSEKIKGYTANHTLDDERQGIKIVYVDATQGWVATTGVNETAPAIITPTYNIDILVVAGGGSGGSIYAGGGGAGGLVYKTSHTLTGSNTYDVVIGAGGAASGASARGNIGVDSTWTINGGAVEFTAKGGGAGGASVGATRICLVGGSGGGSSHDNATGCAATQGGQSGDSGTYGFGFAGGDSVHAPNYNPGGGGGAGSVGGNATSGSSGNGGTGKDLSAVFATEGDSGWFASGGGGGYSADGGSGAGSASAGGGGAGGGSEERGTAGAANTGGGSGGAAVTDIAAAGSYAGGSGVICFKVLTADYSGTTTGSPATRVVGDYTLVEFTGDGSYTA